MTRRQTTISLRFEAYSAAKELASEHGQSVDEFVSQLVLQYSVSSPPRSLISDLGEVSGLLSSILRDAKELNRTVGN